MGSPRPGRPPLLALVALLVLVALPALHPGAWAHGAFDPGAQAAAASAGEPAGTFLADAHLRCPLCRALAQGRALVASSRALPLPAARAVVLRVPAPAPRVPSAPGRDVCRARAPPASA